MAKSKLLTAAALSSALVLAACGGNTNEETNGGEVSETGTDIEAPLVIEPEETIELVVDEVVATDPIIEETIVDAYNELLDLTVVYFDYDQSSIREEFIEILDAHAEFLAMNPEQVIVLEGHADERGTREYNLALGERRAKQVATFLQIKGVAGDQIDVVSYGEEKPLAIGKSEADYSQNRRVEIVYK